MNVDYRRKLYALLQNPQQSEEGDRICQRLACFQMCDRDYLTEIKRWWQADAREIPASIASSSDRINLQSNSAVTENLVFEIRHPISGQNQNLHSNDESNEDIEIPQEIIVCQDARTVYWWFWRFYPEIRARTRQDLLLYPADEIVPDCPLHSYQTTVSALVGAMYPVERAFKVENSEDESKPERPYLILFTFSPIQEFIKASRKFLDFWAGSYLLHYLGAKLCWYIANKYGADAVITPSLWQQEIIDALIIKEFDRDGSTVFRNSFPDSKAPVTRFENKESTSLATAGFPNVITALVPGKTEAEKLGKELIDFLQKEWKSIAEKVRNDIKKTVINEIETDDKLDVLWSKISDEFNLEYREELLKLRKNKGTCWTWRTLWEAQIDRTWEPYWTAVPLGDPDTNLMIVNQQDVTYTNWENSQNRLANSRIQPQIATDAEKQLYQYFNVGTWWGSLQARLGQLIQSVKNTRSWQIATSPGERSSLSGRFSALHPLYNYGQFPEGGGLPAGSLRLFWRVMAEVYPGLFNGSEMLNAIELSKRMAWQHGGVAESLGIDVETTITRITPINDSETERNSYSQKDSLLNYEKLIRFPNLSSIAAAKFAYEHPSKVRQYWNRLRKLIERELPEYENQFGSRTRGRPFQVSKTDLRINPAERDGQNFNGVMFSTKWLADDMSLKRDKTNVLRGLIEQAHKDSGFINGSPADWWVIVLGDGDGMGKYVSGAKLGFYEKYIVDRKVAPEIKNKEEYRDLLQKTRKRMGPATHVALNRALLDFSNRLVPYVTEHRFCGKVVYSGGDDVMAVLPLADLPEYLLSIRAAWSGTKDPGKEFTTKGLGAETTEASGYWHPREELRNEGKLTGIPQRPLFTMGKDATMSLGIVIAYKSVPLPTVLETLWTAEKERAKKMPGARGQEEVNSIPVKDGLCFRVIYGSGNVLEALMKGHLLSAWWDFVKEARQQIGENSEKLEEEKKKDLSPLLYRLAEELPKHAVITKNDGLIAKAATVIINRREQNFPQELKNRLIKWLVLWEDWAYHANPNYTKDCLGTRLEDLSKLLRFTAFWLDKMSQFDDWIVGGEES